MQPHGLPLASPLVNILDDKKTSCLACHQIPGLEFKICHTPPRKLKKSNFPSGNPFENSNETPLDVTNNDKIANVKENGVQEAIAQMSGGGARSTFSVGEYPAKVQYDSKIEGVLKNASGTFESRVKSSMPHNGRP